VEGTERRYAKKVRVGLGEEEKSIQRGKKVWRVRRVRRVKMVRRVKEGERG
jgi:hypothetical protein